MSHDIEHYDGATGPPTFSLNSTHRSPDVNTGFARFRRSIRYDSQPFYIRIGNERVYFDDDDAIALARFLLNEAAQR